MLSRPSTALKPFRWYVRMEGEETEHPAVHDYSLTEDGISYDILSESDRTVAVMAYAHNAETGVFVDVTDEERPADAKGMKPQTGIMAAADNTYSVTIPRNVIINNEAYTVEQIAPLAFANKKLLRSVTIPSTVSAIGSSAFSGCIRLEEIVCHAAVPATVPADAFTGVSASRCKLSVPNGADVAYGETDVWRNFITAAAATPLCAVPSATIANGTLLFSCDTPGAQYHYSVSPLQGFALSGSTAQQSLSLRPQYIVSLYATASGYDASEKVTLVLSDTSLNRFDVNADGKVTMSDANAVVNAFVNGTE